MTKAINEMNMEELAAYAVTLKGWDWRLCGGMRPLGIADRVPDKDVEVVKQMSSEEFEEFKRDVVASGFRPDLKDPATLGCVLAMVRKRHDRRCSVAYTREGWKVTKPKTKQNMRTNSWKIVNSWRGMPTEAHALIAALVKEVQS